MTIATTDKTFRSGGHIPIQHIIWLTKDQAAARSHALTPLDDKEPRGLGKNKREAFETIQQVYFKAGEIIQIESKLDGRLSSLLAVGEQESTAKQDDSAKEKPLTKAEKKKVADAEAAQVAAETELQALKGEVATLANTLRDAEAAQEAAEAGTDDAAKDTAAADLDAADKMVGEFLNRFATPDNAGDGDGSAS